MAYPRHQRSRDFKFFTRTVGNLSLVPAGNIWADLPTIGATWDAALTAAIGDVIEVGLSATSDHIAGTNTFFDVFSMISGAVVNSFASGVAAINTSTGISSWWHSNAIAGQKSAGSVMYTLQAGDISGGIVIARLRYRNDGTTAARNLYGTAAMPLQFWAKNLGPADPN